mmetsp:Transcript_17923/g.42405  ORF Transcript_17923/g.42405 Transcript_17923/m.42405 type:complete len:209 (-) Transcript_17923:154-780(-)
MRAQGLASLGGEPGHPLHQQSDHALDRHRGAPPLRRRGGWARGGALGRHVRLHPRLARRRRGRARRIRGSPGNPQVQLPGCLGCGQRCGQRGGLQPGGGRRPRRQSCVGREWRPAAQRPRLRRQGPRRDKGSGDSGGRRPGLRTPSGLGCGAARRARLDLGGGREQERGEVGRPPRRARHRRPLPPRHLQHRPAREREVSPLHPALGP